MPCWHRVCFGGAATRWVARPTSFAKPKTGPSLFGFEVEIADEVARRMGLKAQFVQGDKLDLFAMQDNGTVDISLAGLEVTPERRRKTTLSKSYYYFTHCLLVRANDHRIGVLRDCRGLRVGTLSGPMVRDLIDTVGGIVQVKYPEHISLLTDLEAGKVDAALLDSPIVAYYARPNPKLKVVGPQLPGGEYAIGIGRAGEVMKEDVDKALGTMVADGTLKKILGRWDLWDEEEQSHFVGDEGVTSATGHTAK